jgi:hypothetical protein
MADDTGATPVPKSELRGLRDHMDLQFKNLGEKVEGALNSNKELEERVRANEQSLTTSRVWTKVMVGVMGVTGTLLGGVLVKLVFGGD